MKINKSIIESITKDIANALIRESRIALRPQGYNVINEMDFRKFNDTENGDGKLKGVYQRIFDGLIKAEGIILKEINGIIIKTVTDDTLARECGNFFRSKFSKYFKKYVITPCNNLAVKAYDGTTVKNEPLRDVAYFIQDKFNTFKEEITTEFENIANTHRGKNSPTLRRLSSRINGLLQNYDDKLFKLIDNYGFEGNTKRNIGEGKGNVSLNEGIDRDYVVEVVRLYIWNTESLYNKIQKIIDEMVNMSLNGREVTVRTIIKNKEFQYTVSIAINEYNKTCDRRDCIRDSYKFIITHIRRSIADEIYQEYEDKLRREKNEVSLNSLRESYNFSNIFAKYDDKLQGGSKYINLKDIDGEEGIKVEFFDKEHRPHVDGYLFLKLCKNVMGDYYIDGHTDLTYYLYGDEAEDGEYEEYNSINNFSIGEENGDLYIYGSDKEIEQYMKSFILAKSRQCIDGLIRIQENVRRGVLNENKRYFLGINGAIYRDRGDWSDGAVEWKGRLYNATVLSDSMYEAYEAYCDSEGIEWDEDGYYKWCESEDGLFDFEEYIYWCDSSGDFEILDTKLFEDCKSVYVVKDREYNGIWYEGKLYDEGEVRRVVEEDDDDDDGYHANYYTPCTDYDFIGIEDKLTPISEDLEAKNVGHRGKVRENRKRITESTYQGQKLDTYYTDGEYYYYAYISEGRGSFDDQTMIDLCDNYNFTWHDKKDISQIEEGDDVYYIKCDSNGYSVSDTNRGVFVVGAIVADNDSDFDVDDILRELNSDEVVFCKIDDDGTIVDEVGLLTCDYGYDVDFHSMEVGFNPDDLEEVDEEDLPFSV